MKACSNKSFASAPVGGRTAFYHHHEATGITRSSMGLAVLGKKRHVERASMGRQSDEVRVAACANAPLANDGHQFVVVDGRVDLRYLPEHGDTLSLVSAEH